MDKAEEVKALAAESARQIRKHLEKHGSELTEEQRQHHESVAERKEAEAGR